MPVETIFSRSVQLPVSLETAFAYHERKGALDRLIPPWEKVAVTRSDHSLEPSSEVLLTSWLGPLPLKWLARHEGYRPPEFFSDRQVSGPFAYWMHEHRFEAVASEQPSASPGTTLEDHVTYKLPLGFLGSLLGSGLVRRKLQAMFAYRHRITCDDLTLLRKHCSAAMKVAVSGSSGLVGNRLCSFLSLMGHSVQRLVRGAEDSETPEDSLHIWDENANCDALQQTDVVVHLAGKSIADKRWSPSVKEEIRSSRVEKTRILCERLAKLEKPPRVLICASAIGIYGDQQDAVLDEGAATGSDFLADVGKQWEAACEPARAAGIRVVNLRIGIVLSPRGGALQKLLLPAKLGVNGPVGNGKQWWSWIDIDDLLGTIYHCINNDQISGPVNAVSPKPVTCREFARVLGRVLRRPAFVPAPAFALNLALGEMAGPLLLSSTRVEPAKLVETEYAFRFPDLESSLRYQLGRPDPARVASGS